MSDLNFYFHTYASENSFLWPSAALRNCLRRKHKKSLPCAEHRGSRGRCDRSIRDKHTSTRRHDQRIDSRPRMDYLRKNQSSERELKKVKAPLKLIDATCSTMSYLDMASLALVSLRALT